MDDIKSIFLSAPPGQIDPSVLPLVEAWDEKPTALQILRVLDAVIHGGAASGFAVQALEMFMRSAIREEGTTYEDVVSKAVWRDAAG